MVKCYNCKVICLQNMFWTRLFAVVLTIYKWSIYQYTFCGFRKYWLTRNETIPALTWVQMIKRVWKIGFKWQVGFFFFFHVLEKTLLVDLELDNCCKLLRRKQARIIIISEKNNDNKLIITVKSERETQGVAIQHL